MDSSSSLRNYTTALYVNTYSLKTWDLIYLKSKVKRCYVLELEFYLKGLESGGMNCKRGYFPVYKIMFVQYFYFGIYASCSFHACQILVTVNNAQALFALVDKFPHSSWCVKLRILLACENVHVYSIIWHIMVSSK